MSRGHHTKDRRERRQRDDRYSDPRDAYYPGDYPAATTAGYGATPPPSYDAPAYESDSHHKPRRSKSGREKAPPLHRRGLNEDYYNAAPVEEEYEKPRRSHRKKHDRHGRRRSEDRYDSHHYTEPVGSDEEADHYPPKPRRRAKTEERGRDRPRRSRRYDDEYSDDENYATTPEERPGKPKRSRSFLEKIGIGKADKQPEYDRGRSPGRSPSPRGRRGHRAYSYSPSPPPRRHRSEHRGRAKSAGESLRNPQWQKAAGSAMRAGASAAYQLRHDPSPWIGPKGIRVATAALGAAMMDQMMEENEPCSRGRGGGGGGQSMRSRAVNRLGEAALAHFVAGGRSKSRGRSGRRH